MACPRFTWIWINKISFLWKSSLLWQRQQRADELKIIELNIAGYIASCSNSGLSLMIPDSFGEAKHFPDISVNLSLFPGDTHSKKAAGPGKPTTAITELL